jgi:hypothetical protein
MTHLVESLVRHTIGGSWWPAAPDPHTFVELSMSTQPLGTTPFRGSSLSDVPAWSPGEGVVAIEGRIGDANESAGRPRRVRQDGSRKVRTPQSNGGG